MTDRNYHNATHLLASAFGGTPLRCHVLGRRAGYVRLLLCSAPTTQPREVFVAPSRVTELPSSVEDLL